jgi:hypothetical protein
VNTNGALIAFAYFLAKLIVSVFSFSGISSNKSYLAPIKIAQAV